MKDDDNKGRRMKKVTEPQTDFLSVIATHKFTSTGIKETLILRRPLHYSIVFLK